MIEIPTYISGHQRVVEAFGYWPSFHDSPVSHFERTSDRVIVASEVWEMTSEVDGRGFFVLRNRHRVEFSFAGILGEDLDQFIPENILFSLRFSPVASFADRGWFEVEFDSAMGSDAGGSLSATRGEVAQLSRIAD